MIHAEFFSKGGMPVGFRVCGHSDVSEAGTDIVCAAVSSAAYLTANTITDVMDVPADVSVQNGMMSLKVPEKGVSACSALLKGFRLHMGALQKQYSQNIKVTDMEV